MTPAPRVAPLDAPYPPDMQADFDKLMRGAPPLKLFRTVGRNPRVLARMMAGGLLDKGSISIRARELMILRTTALCGAEYEWGVHVAVYGAKAGLSKEEIAATVHGGHAWSREDAAVIALAEALHRRPALDNRQWEDAKNHFADEQLIELLMLAGLYRAVSYLCNGLAIEHEAFAPKFPPA